MALRLFLRSSCLAASKSWPAVKLPRLRQKSSFHKQINLPYPVEGGVGRFLPPPALATVLEFQQGLLDRLNDETEGTEFENMSVVDTIIATAPHRSHTLAFNYASQALNNSFFLQNLKPPPEDRENHEHHLSGSLFNAIKASYSDFNEFKSEFSAAALGLSSSGWVWLVSNELGNIAILPTHGAGTLLIRSRTHVATLRPEEKKDTQDTRRIESVVMEDPAAFGQQPIDDEVEELADQEEYDEEQEEDEYERALQEALESKDAQYTVQDPVFESLDVQWGKLSSKQKLNAMLDYEQDQEMPFKDQIEREMEAAALKDAEIEDDVEEGNGDDSQTPPPAEGSTRSRAPGPAPSSPVSGVSASANLAASNSTLPKSIHTSAISRAEFGNTSYLKSNLFDGSSKQQQSFATGSRDKVDMLNHGRTIFPLLCLSVHEHAWMSAGRGVWGKEEYAAEFWNVVNWEKVDQLYESYKFSSDADAAKFDK